jgi:metallophosphoesterase (TIGR03767 family)
MVTLTPVRTSPGPTTAERVLVPDTPGPGGYHRLRTGPGEPHLARTDLGGTAPPGSLRPLLAFVQLSDLHVVDAQSPSRAEFLDRLGDPDSPVAATIGPIGAYRPQEAMSFHVVDAMMQAVNRLTGGPVTGQPLSFVISTGDNVDNGQRNELDAYIRLLDGGGRVRPDSGGSSWEGVGSPDWYDPRYWHPDGTPAGEGDDVPRGERGFPVVPGLLDAARQPFGPIGAGLPWYEVHGNHDELLGGTVPATAGLAWLARGRRKPTGLAWSPSAEVVEDILGDHRRRPPDLLRELGSATWREVTPDPGRVPARTAGWLEAHRRDGARPARARTWYGFDAGRFRCLVLDTVNAHGGWQGSLDAEQAVWLEAELEAGSSGGGEDRTFLIFSHHPLATLINDYAPDGRRRVLGAEVAAIIDRHPNVAVWFNGHTHTHAVRAHPRTTGPGWWEVTTASHADWPQQGRVVELAEDPVDGSLVVVTTVIDHAGILDPRHAGLGDPTTLAGWSRELAANHWQRARVGDEPAGRGDRSDRNTLLVRPC